MCVANVDLEQIGVGNASQTSQTSQAALPLKQSVWVDYCPRNGQRLAFENLKFYTRV